MLGIKWASDRRYLVKSKIYVKNQRWAKKIKNVQQLKNSWKSCKLVSETSVIYCCLQIKPAGCWIYYCPRETSVDPEEEEVSTYWNHSLLFRCIVKYYSLPQTRVNLDSNIVLLSINSFRTVPHWGGYLRTLALDHFFFWHYYFSTFK